MEGVFQVLIVIGIIVFAIVRQADEAAEKRKKRARTNTPKPYRPETTVDYGDKPVPAPFLSYDYEQNMLSSPSTNMLQAESSIKNTAQNIAVSSPITELQDTEQEFDIHSTEDVRRGIIWTEILNRKYWKLI